MPKKFYTSAPKDFALCLHESCQCAASCLRQTTYVQQVENNDCLLIVNPMRCVPTGECPFFRDATPVTYACGFTNFQSHMFPQQYSDFMSALMEHFGRNPYFERRNGTVPIPPAEQEFILRTACEVGVTKELHFDSYIQNPNWND